MVDKVYYIGDRTGRHFFLCDSLFLNNINLYNSKSVLDYLKSSLGEFSFDDCVFLSFKHNGIDIEFAKQILNADRNWLILNIQNINQDQYGELVKFKLEDI